MSNIFELRGNVEALQDQLRRSTGIERDAAALLLSQAGEEGVRALVEIARALDLEVANRVSALRHVPADAVGRHQDVFRELLADAEPVIRLTALRSIGDARATGLLDSVRSLLSDSAVVQDLDDELSVAREAQKTVQLLTK